MTDSQALLQEGLAAFRARAYDQALRAWRTLLSFEPDHPQVKELVARTEALAAEGQIVHQLKEELADLREELATTRDSRNDLLLEMARVHKRYEEREARLWRMQEAREWELREALADAELQSFRIADGVATSESELLHASEDRLERPQEKPAKIVSTHSPGAALDPSAGTEALQHSHEQVRVLRKELSLAHERIVELEQQVQQYEHDENQGEYPALDANLTLSHAVYDALSFTEEEQAAAFDHVIPEDDDNEDAFGFLAPSAFQAVESQTIDTDQHINEDALFGVNPTATQNSNIIDDFDSYGSGRTAEDADENDFSGPLFADDVLNQPTDTHVTPSLHRANDGRTQNLERNIIQRDDPPTGSFDPSDDDDLDGVPSEDEPIIDALVGLVIEETSGMIHVASAAKRTPTSPVRPSFEAVTAPPTGAHDDDDGASIGDRYLETALGASTAPRLGSEDDAHTDTPLESVAAPLLGSERELGDADPLLSLEEDFNETAQLLETVAPFSDFEAEQALAGTPTSSQRAEMAGSDPSAPESAKADSLELEDASLEADASQVHGEDNPAQDASDAADAGADEASGTEGERTADGIEASSPAVDPAIAALPPARSRDEAADTAEIDLQPIDDKNLADGFGEELADALSSTPEPPRLMTGVQPDLPDFDFMEDEPEQMAPEELERRPTWIPVRHKAKPKVDDAVARYLLTHIDGVSTFMELRGTVGLPPAAVDSGFRTLLAGDIIRARKG